MQEKEMNPEERKCGNCAARIFTSHPPGTADGYCRAPGRPEISILSADPGCPDHRNKAEQAARWEARALSADAWLTSKADYEAREAREKDYVALLAGMAARYEQALAGVADAERMAVVAWLRDTERCTESARVLR